MNLHRSLNNHQVQPALVDVQCVHPHIIRAASDCSTFPSWSVGSLWGDAGTAASFGWWGSWLEWFYYKQDWWFTFEYHLNEFFFYSMDSFLILHENLRC